MKVTWTGPNGYHAEVGPYKLNIWIMNVETKSLHAAWAWEVSVPGICLDGGYICRTEAEAKEKAEAWVVAAGIKFVTDLGLDLVMEARLLKKYMDHAEAVRKLVYIGPEGHQRRSAAQNVHALGFDLGAHEGQTVNSKNQPAKGWLADHWLCNPDCLTCYEKRTEELRGPRV
jgi:hypothetical protein